MSAKKWMYMNHKGNLRNFLPIIFLWIFVVNFSFNFIYSRYFIFFISTILAHHSAKLGWSVCYFDWFNGIIHLERTNFPNPFDSYNWFIQLIHDSIRKEFYWLVYCLFSTKYQVIHLTNWHVRLIGQYACMMSTQIKCLPTHRVALCSTQTQQYDSLNWFGSCIIIHIVSSLIMLKANFVKSIHSIETNNWIYL